MTSGAIRVGIGGWTFEPWRGTFYPDDLPKTRELEYAASRLTAIEVNGTFYSRQSPATFAKWRKAAARCSSSSSTGAKVRAPAAAEALIRKLG